MQSSWTKTLGLVLILLPLETSAQPDLSSVTFKSGTIQHVNQSIVSFTQNPRVWYPEIEVGGRLDQIALHWRTYWSYWNDGVTTPVPWPDAVTFSFRSHTVGIRFLIFPLSEVSFMSIQLGGIIGLSHDFVRRVYIGGSGIDGRRGINGSHGINNVELGVHIGVKLWGPIQGIGEWHRFRRLGAEQFGFPSYRDAYQAGFSVSF